MFVASRRMLTIEHGAGESAAAPSEAEAAEIWEKAHADAVAEDEDT
jgi:hypothetical protein